MFAAVMLVVVALGSVLFHFLSPWWWPPIASNWRYIDDTILITFWITGAVFVAVLLFMAYCVFRFRHRPGNKATYEPENRRLEWWLTIGTGVGVAAMLTPGLFVWNHFITVPPDADRHRDRRPAMAMELPPARAGRPAGHLVHPAHQPRKSARPQPGRSQRQDDLVIQGAELHLPIGKPVKALLRSVDVLHDFYVPEFRAKMDLIPGMVSYFWLTPTRTGKFDILCAELCGVGHPLMRGKVVVDQAGDYQAWLEQQTRAAAGGWPLTAPDQEDKSGGVR